MANEAEARAIRKTLESALTRFKGRSAGKTAPSPSSLHYQRLHRTPIENFPSLPKGTMWVAQKLYEVWIWVPRHGRVDYLYEDRLCQGIDGSDSTGQGWIKDRFGILIFLPSPMFIKVAKEPRRPMSDPATSIDLEPEKVKDSLKRINGPFTG